MISEKEKKAISLQNYADNLKRQYEKTKYSDPDLSEKVADAYENAEEAWVRCSNIPRARQCEAMVSRYSSEHNVPSSKRRLPISTLEKKFPKRSNPYNYTGLKDLYSIIPIFLLIASLFFIAINLTGNTIGGISTNDCSWISFCFFFFALIFTIFYLNSKRKKI